MRITTATLCPCGTPTPNSYLCSACTDTLWIALNKVPALAGELDITLTRQRRFVTQTSGSRSAVEALPYDTAASRALVELRGTLLTLVRRCHQHHVPSTDYRARPPGTTLASMSLWLLWRVDGITAQPWAGDALRLPGVVERCITVIDRPPDKAFAGPCLHCQRDLYASKGDVFVTCPRCGAHYDLAQRRDWLLSVVNDRLATATEIARALTSLEMPVTAERIRQWKHRDRLEARAHDRLDRPLFRVGDVVDLLIEQAEKITA